MNDASSATLTPTQGRRTLLLGLFAVACLLGGGYWLYQRYTHVYISDARIGASMVSVSSRAPGWVTDLMVSASDRVKKDQPLLTLDARDTTLRLREIEAQIAIAETDLARQKLEHDLLDRQTTNRLDAARSRQEAVQTTLATAQSNYNFAKSELERARTLRQQRLLAEREWDSKQTALDTARQAVERSRAELAAAHSTLLEAEASRDQLRQLEQTILRTQHQLEQLQANRQRQQIDLDDRTVLSPIDGVIDETFTHDGEFIGTGQRILLMHAPDQIWVDANIKETDLDHLRLGQQARITVDGYPELAPEGKVVRIGNAAISQFALLPNANPSGNFTKITQRIPIRIAVDQVEGDLLRPGMMVEVAIEVR